MEKVKSSHHIDFELTDFIDKYGISHKLDFELIKKRFFESIEYDEKSLSTSCVKEDDRFDFENIIQNLTIDDLGKYDPSNAESYKKFIHYYYYNFHFIIYENIQRYNKISNIRRYNTTDRLHLSDHKDNTIKDLILSRQLNKYSHNEVFKLNVNEDNCVDYIKFILGSSMLDLKDEKDLKSLQDIVYTLMIVLNDTSIMFKTLKEYGVKDEHFNNTHNYDSDSKHNSIIEKFFYYEFKYREFTWISFLLNNNNLLTEVNKKDDEIEYHFESRKKQYEHLVNLKNNFTIRLKVINDFTTAFPNIELVNTENINNWDYEKMEYIPTIEVRKVSFDDFFNNCDTYSILNDIFNFHSLRENYKDNSPEKEKLKNKFNNDLKDIIKESFNKEFIKNNSIELSPIEKLSFKALEKFKNDISESLIVRFNNSHTLSYDLGFTVSKGIYGYKMYKNDSHYSFTDGNYSGTCEVREIQIGNYISWTEEALKKLKLSYKIENNTDEHYLILSKKFQSWRDKIDTNYICHAFKLSDFLKNNNEDGLFKIIDVWFSDTELTHDFIQSVMDKKLYNAQKLIDEKLKEIENLKKML